MSLAATGDLVQRAVDQNGAVAAFNVITLEHAEGIVRGAELAGREVILQLSENTIRFHHGQLEPIAGAMADVAHQATVDVALHLDHIQDEALLRRIVNTEFSSAMFDAGACPYEQNVTRTRAAATWAHSAGIWLEAELGYVGGKPGSPSGAHVPGVRTDPSEAADFVCECGVDALAVAVGTSHAMTTREAALDCDRVADIRSLVPVPLVLHGSSGVADDQLRAVIVAGIAKVNIGTALNVAMTRSIRTVLQDNDRVWDPREYLEPARQEIGRTVFDILAVVGGPSGAGRPA